MTRAGGRNVDRRQDECVAALGAHEQGRGGGARDRQQRRNRGAVGAELRVVAGQPGRVRTDVPRRVRDRQRLAQRQRDQGDQRDRAAVTTGNAEDWAVHVHPMITEPRA